MSVFQRRVARALGIVVPLVPAGVKSPVKQRIPKRFHRYFTPNWHRWALHGRGKWELLGKLQLDFLVAQGLKPHHHLLDVGCGPLRAGVRLIPYLEPGHYYGIDRDAPRLAAGREIELKRYNLEGRRPVLEVMDDFGFERLGREFDFAIAQSVFTHLTINEMIRCLVNMEKVLKPGGRFFATFYLNPDGKSNLADIEQSTTGIISHLDRDNFHYEVSTFEWIVEGTRLRADYVGDWGSPQNQKMIAFTKV